MMSTVRSLAIVPSGHLFGIQSGGHQRTCAILEAMGSISEVDIVSYEQAHSPTRSDGTRAEYPVSLGLEPWPSSHSLTRHVRLAIGAISGRPTGLHPDWGQPIRTLVAQNSYDFCLFRYAEPFLHTGPIAVPTLVDYDDPMCERVLVRGLQAGTCRRVIAILHSRLLRAEYCAALKHAHSVLVTKPDDMSLCPTTNGHILPNVAFSVNQDEPDPPFDNTPTGFFIGTLNYAPNTDAVDRLLETIWPLVQTRVPESRLIIAGHGAAESAMRRWCRHPSVQFRLSPATLRDAYSGSWIALNL